MRSDAPVKRREEPSCSLRSQLLNCSAYDGEGWKKARSAFVDGRGDLGTVAEDEVKRLMNLKQELVGGMSSRDRNIRRTECVRYNNQLEVTTEQTIDARVKQREAKKMEETGKFVKEACDKKACKRKGTHIMGWPLA